MKVVILARGTYWSAADELMRAFKEQEIDCVLISFKLDDHLKRLKEEDFSTVYFYSEEKPDEKALEWTKKNRIFINMTRAQDILEGADRVICVPSGMVRNIKRQLKSSPTVIIASKYYKERDVVDAKLKEAHPIFAIPSIIEYCPEGSYPFFPPHEFPSISKVKSKEKVVVVHGILRDTEQQLTQKGSGKIRKAVRLAKNKVDFEYKELIGLKFWNVITEKARAHIFIDCLNPDMGIGKSVWESIALDSVVLSCLKRDVFVSNEFYPERFPVIDVRTSKELVNELVKLVSDRKKLDLEIVKVTEWKRYLSHKHVVEYFLSCWGIQNDNITTERKRNEVDDEVVSR